MTRIEPLLLPVIVLAVFLCGCSSKSSSPEKDATVPATAASAKPKFDFGTAELSPASGGGREAALRVTIKPGSQKPSLVGVLINERQNGGEACYVFRNLTNNSNMLVADAGTGGIQLGKQTSVSNKQCELLSDGTGSTEDPSGITLTFHIRFRSAFRGAKHIWVMPTDAIGNGPEMKLAGDWTVQ